MKKYLVFFAHEDYADLSLFALDVEEELSLDDPDEVREETLGIVSDLLEAGLIRPGFPTRDGGFEPWALSAEAALARIVRGWNELDHEPTLGDIVWFEATEKGEKYIAGYSPRDSGLAIENAP